jgi:hypothetical protein
MKSSTRRSNGFDQSDCPYSPGQEVAESGLYEVCHHDEPRTKVILTAKEVFAHCRKCGEKVRYKLLQAVPHISEDPDFLESAPAVVSIPPSARQSKQSFPLQLGLDHGFRFWQAPAEAGGDSPEGGDL